jgi:hypothetical protein
MTFKLGLRQNTDKPLLICEVPDSRRWIDGDGHVTPFEPKYWNVEELRTKYPKLLLKVSTNGEKPELAPAIDYPTVQQSRDVYSAPRKFEFGQLGYVKLPTAKFFDIPTPCIVVDGSLDNGVLIFHTLLRQLQFVPHALFVTPSGMALTKRDDQAAFRDRLFALAYERAKQEGQVFAGDLGSSREFPTLSLDPLSFGAEKPTVEEMDVDRSTSAVEAGTESDRPEDGEIVEEKDVEEVVDDHDNDGVNDSPDPLSIDESKVEEGESADVENDDL